MLRKVSTRVNTRCITRRCLAAPKNYLAVLKVSIDSGGGKVSDLEQDERFPRGPTMIGNICDSTNEGWVGGCGEFDDRCGGL
jgi:hypothetical protein